jgi:hypothetical protein
MVTPKSLRKSRHLFCGEEFAQTTLGPHSNHGALGTCETIHRRSPFVLMCHRDSLLSP